LWQSTCMGADKKCIVELLGAANQSVDEAKLPALEMVEAGKKTDLGQYVVSCERCDADFTLSADSGEQPQMRLLEPPPEASDACDVARYRQVGDWAANLSIKWFNVEILKPKEQDVSEEDKGKPELLLEGLEMVLNNVAGNLAWANRIRSGEDTQCTPDQATQLTNDALATIRILNTILRRRDDSTWHEEISKRSEHTG
jgi:hypothetical protein